MREDREKYYSFRVLFIGGKSVTQEARIDQIRLNNQENPAGADVFNDAF